MMKSFMGRVRAFFTRGHGDEPVPAGPCRHGRPSSWPVRFSGYGPADLWPRDVRVCPDCGMFQISVDNLFAERGRPEWSPFGSVAGFFYDHGRERFVNTVPSDAWPYPARLWVGSPVYEARCRTDRFGACCCNCRFMSVSRGVGACRHPYRAASPTLSFDNYCLAGPGGHGEICESYVARNPLAVTGRAVVRFAAMADPTARLVENHATTALLSLDNGNRTAIVNKLEFLPEMAR